MIDLNEIEERIASAISGAQVSVRDLTGELTYFEATIVSPAFAGKGLVDQHQMVYGALGEELLSQLHALSIKTYTPEQWQQLSGTAPGAS